jgi:hypothetical protein
MPRDVAPLTNALDETTPGNQSDIYQLLAAWNRSIEAALNVGPGRTETVMKQYFEDVVSLVYTTATGDQIDWEFLAECCEAYPPDVGDHVCSSLLVNVVGRCIVRVRIEDGVEEIPAWALEYLSAISAANDGQGNELEASVFGWGIGHSSVAVTEQTLDRAAAGKHDWAAIVLEHATYADRDSALELFEQLVRVPEIKDPFIFLTALDRSREQPRPPLPEFWEPPAEYDWEIEFTETQRDRILEAIGDAVSPAELKGVDHQFSFDLQGVADEAFEQHLPESATESMLRIGQYQGGKWHLLDDIGCPDGDSDRVDTVEPLFEFQYRLEDPILGQTSGLNLAQQRGPDLCRQCADTVSNWKSSRYNYATARDKDYNGGTLVTWTPLSEDRWVRACDICQKPGGASHVESTFDQAACPCCLRELSKSRPHQLDIGDTDKETPLSFEEILTGTVETRTLPPRDVLEERAAEQRRQHNRQREHLPVTHIGLTQNKVNILTEHGYETVKDLCDADPETLGDISGLGRRWQPERLPHTYTLSLTAFDGIGSTLAERLKEHGYGSLPALEAASAEELADIKGMSLSKAERILETVDSWNTPEI